MVIFPFSPLSPRARTRHLQLKVSAGLGIDGYFGNRHNKLASPFSNAGHLRHDLVFEIPRQNEQIVGLGFLDLVGMQDRDMRSGEELALLVGIAVHGVVDEIRADATVIQQRVAFARGSVSDDRLAFPPDADQELQKLPLGLFYLLSKIPICLNLAEPSLMFSSPQFDNAVANRLRVVLLVSPVDSQRPAVRRQLLYVEQFDTVPSKDFLGSNK